MKEHDLAQAVGAHLAAADAAVNDLLGLSLERISPGEARCKLVVRDELVNSHAVCHGGVIFALADTALAYASSSRNRTGMTQSASIVFTRAAKLGDILEAVAAVETDGRRTTSATVRVRNQKNQLIALVQASSLRLDEAVLSLPAPE